MQKHNAFALIPHYILSSDLTAEEKLLCAFIDSYVKAYGNFRLQYETIAEAFGKYDKNGNPNVNAIKKTISRLYKKGIVKNVGNMQKRDLRLAYMTTPEAIEVEEAKKTQAPKDTSEKEKNFEAFWKIYPRKEHKATARKRFMKLSVRKQRFVLETLPQFLEQVHGRQKQYILLPGTYLQQEVYEDFEPVGDEPEAKSSAESHADGGGVPMWERVWALYKRIEADPTLQSVALEELARAQGWGDEAIETLIELIGDTETLIDQSYERANIKSIFAGYAYA